MKIAALMEIARSASQRSDKRASGFAEMIEDAGPLPASIAQPRKRRGSRSAASDDDFCACGMQSASNDTWGARD
jgi:hypothetical protein